MTIAVVSASAGSGKTYRLASDLFDALSTGAARPEGVVAITYTVKAAGELESRVRRKLLDAGRADLAARVRDGYFGTIHSVCQRLLREFALEAGLSPFLEPVPESERLQVFDRALATVIAGNESEANGLAQRLAIDDWKGVARTLVERARENGMDAEALRRSAETSERGLRALFPPIAIAAGDYRARFAAALEAALPALDAASAESGDAGKRAALARRAHADVRRFGLPAWKDQVQLARALDKKKLAPIAGPLAALVAEHEGCEAFQGDLLRVQRLLFEVAARAVEAFAAEKAGARAVDFGDMLALAHGLLARSDVRAALGARLDLVLVDEFQDTSPLQLALVAALASVARRSIWVGDRKQAIYGFQGSDPELMTAAVEAALAGRAPDILGSSWRSRPALVEACSDLFATALAPHGFPEEQVRLTPARKDPAALAAQPAFEAWRWAPERVDRAGVAVKATEADAIAAGVEALLADGPLVGERVEGEPEERVRKATRRDVAVLAFTNPACRQIARALAVRGIPARVSLEGLARTPEAILARAALALLADPSDGVAALEVSWLGGAAASDPDAWLSRRLVEMERYRAERDQAERAGEPSPERPLPFSDDPRVAALRSSADEARRASPAEALDLALRSAGVAALLRGWPEPEQRLANLEALRAEARDYEELCRVRHSAGTASGLVARLGELDETAKQAQPSAEDAVTVSTWHGAKGLEWPVVILATLEHDRGRDVFEVAVEPAARFDFARPLAGRSIRWWPWPYGKMSANLALLARALQTPEAAATAERDRREKLRLLYVGFTRARDLLAWVAKRDPRSGLGLAALAPLQDEAGALRIELPFGADPGAATLRVGKGSWRCGVRALSGVPPERAAGAAAGSRWYDAGARAARPPERVNPSSEPLATPARLVSVLRLAGRRDLRASAEAAGAVGDAIHAFLAADDPGPPPERMGMAARLLSAHGVAGALAPETLLAVSDALRAFLEARYPGAAWRREWPIRARLGGTPSRLVSGEVDLVLELPRGFVLVDHKSFPGSEAERDRKIVEDWSPQLGWYARVLEKALGKPLSAAFVHLPIRGELAEVELSS